MSRYFQINKDDKSEASSKISPAKVVWIRFCSIPSTFKFSFFLNIHGRMCPVNTLLVRL